MTVSAQPMNVVVVAADTLRTAYLGAYGNSWIRTPNIDRFASEGVRFSRAHPECLPTIPTRRTLHSGRRAFPFHGYDPVPWDNVYLPGWQPMSPDEPTVAERMVEVGYHTGFVADVPHYFVPGMNFTRGFRQWEFVRGQAEDRWGAIAHVDEKLLAKYHGAENRIRAHIVNVKPGQPEEEWPTARTFRWAMRFVEQNRGSTPFYLYVDSFTPHETWESPLHYYEMYGDLDAREPIWLTVPYASANDHPDIEPQLPSIRANYAGLVTMVDTWFGRLLDTIDRVGLRDNTLVVFLSDHGTNFADNAERVLGKPAHSLYPGTMDIPLIIRSPGLPSGQVVDELVTTLDVPATVLAVAEANGDADGRDLRAPVDRHEYVTCRYGNFAWYRDADTWFFSRVDFADPKVFDLNDDPECTTNIAGRAADRIARASTRLLADAGGPMPLYRRRRATDAIGRPQFDAE